MVRVSSSTVVRRARGALWRSLPGSVLILQPDDSVVRLTGPGRALWLVLDQPATVAELEQAFAAPADDHDGSDADGTDADGTDADAGDGALAAGVRRYLGELEELGLVTLGPVPPGSASSGSGADPA